MSVSMVKRVSAGMLTGIESVPVTVSLVKRATVLRAVRLFLRSNVLAYVDVVQLSDGAVWTVAVRLPDAYRWEPRHVRTRARRDDFDAAIGARVAFEAMCQALERVAIVR